MAKSRDLTGRRFGHLTVIERTDEKKNRYYLWKCRCDCGNELLACTRDLTDGRKTSCGCRKKRQTTPRDRTGETYGALTAVKRLYAKEKEGFLWECRCQCGNTIVVTPTDLHRRLVRDCGCGATRKPRYRDISGIRKGNLVAIHATENRSKSGSVIWLCRCDCGKELEISENDLMFGTSVSCGCVREQVKRDGHLTDSLTFVDGTCVEWLRNRKRRSDNRSGYRGVYRQKSGKYKVYIGLKNERYYLGLFDSFEHAVEVRQSVERFLHDGFIECWDGWKARADENASWARENPFHFTVEKADHCFYVTTTDGEIRSLNYG